MSIANGKLIFENDFKIKAEFDNIDGNHYVFEIQLAVPIPPFEPADAILRYNSESQLEAIQQVEGVLGDPVFNLNTSHGLVIEGVFSEPGRPTTAVVGEGFWIQA
ncbi:uncharacterized protein FOMMEDRAFT_22926 [Fomitiporia mediterranea MF3/22]|uniref:uncharacterized protein n=1 Tax=Fomitiporia mediterranea (strain MF3/22) TaxID=694068 RepID=UPI0004407F45|nr:uncharacterized protein FOMMEDRAFT_22926 [Fomitiporia mediterranea MF3/22]EJC99926.1 hypothetical protein FOMMEDRAFT_22926 [Fomitiporia mediterranea MF3/22]